MCVKKSNQNFPMVESTFRCWCKICVSASMFE